MRLMRLMWAFEEALAFPLVVTNSQNFCRLLAGHLTLYHKVLSYQLGAQASRSATH
jgi:hypothetical protein